MIMERLREKCTKSHNGKMYTYSELAEYAKLNMDAMTNGEMAANLGISRSMLLTAMNQHEVRRYKVEFWWTPEMVAYLVANYKTMGDTDIAINLGMGMRGNGKKPCKRVEKKRWHMGLVRTSEEVQAIRDANAWNWNPAHVRKGDAHWHNMPLGSVIFRQLDGRQYLMIKVERGRSKHNISATGSWMPLGRKVWEDAHGEIPKGHVVRFVGTDPSDPEQYVIENLKLGSWSENAAMNREIWPTDLRRVMRLLKKLNRRIEDATK